MPWRDLRVSGAVVEGSAAVGVAGWSGRGATHVCLFVFVCFGNAVGLGGCKGLVG